jgi:hypothetical protein
MADTLFLVATWGALPFWILLVVAPRWRWTHRLVQSTVLVFPLALAYLGALALDGPPRPGAGFATLGGVVALLGSREAILAGWIHYVLIDLWTGAWEVRDAERCGIPHGLVVPCLLLTLALAPLGLMAYVVLRLVRTGRLALDEAPVTEPAGGGSRGDAPEPP